VWLRAQAPAEEHAAEELAPVGAVAAAPAVAAPATAAPATGGAEAVQLPVARQPSNGVHAAPDRTLEEPVLRPEVLSSLSGRLDLLVRLGAAHDAGVLTDEEFDREKNRLLSV
jgi:hypothetical protein